jgi:hypothetical protein
MEMKLPYVDTEKSFTGIALNNTAEDICVSSNSSNLKE